MFLRLITYNLLNGGTTREHLIFEVLKVSSPDVMLLQEVMDQATLQEFAKALNMYFFFAEGNSERHLGLLSRFPIISHHSYHPLPLRHTLLEATIEYVPNQFVHLFGVHFLAHYSVFCEWWRIWEVKTVLERVSEYRSEPCLIAGDFNAIAPQDRVNVQALPTHFKVVLFLQGGRIFRNAIARITSAGFTDCYRMLHACDDGFTLPTPEPHVRLDYIFANQPLVKHIQKCYVVTEPSAIHKASDHYPVIAELDL